MFDKLAFVILLSVGIDFEHLVDLLEVMLYGS
jgi:hypothetical protein